MSMWHGLVGTPKHAGGISGTVTIPVGSMVIAITAHSTAGGSVTLLDGTNVPIPAGTWWVEKWMHTLNVSYTGAVTLTFTTTDSYYVEYIKAGNV